MVYKGVDRITPRNGTGDNEGLNRRYKRKWNAAMNESANWKTLFFSVLSLFCRGNACSLTRSRSIYTCQRCACRCKFRDMFFLCVTRISIDILLDVENSLFVNWALYLGSYHKRSIFTNWTFCRNIDEHCCKCVEQNEMLVRSSWCIKMEINRLDVAASLRDSGCCSERTRNHTVTHVNVIK